MLAKIIWLEPFWVALLATTLLSSDYFWDLWVRPWVILALFIFWPLRLLATRRLSVETPLNWPMLCLLGWLPLPIWNSLVFQPTWEAISYPAIGIATYFALLNWVPLHKRPWLLLGVFIVIGLVLAGLGPAVFEGIPNKIFTFSEEVQQSAPVKLFGTNETVNTNILAGALLPIIPIFVALALWWDWTKHKWLPALSALFSLFLLGTLFLAQSRGSYLAMLIALTVLFALRWRWALLVLAVPLLAIVLTAGSELQLLLNAITTGSASSSAVSRWEIWMHALTVLQSYPLLGIGIGTFETVLQQLYPVGSSTLSFAGIPHAHNLILQVGLDLGLPGLAFYLAGWAIAFRTLLQFLHPAPESNEPEMVEPISRSERRKVRHARRQLRRQKALLSALSAGLLGSGIALWLHGMVDCTIWGTKVSFIPWLLLAYISLLFLQNQSLQVQSEHTMTVPE